MSSIISRFLRNVQQSPDKPALILGEEIVSYAALAEEVRRLAGSFDAMGIGRNTNLFVALSNCREFAVTMLAAADRCAVIVPVSPGLPAAALAVAAQATKSIHCIAHSTVLQGLFAKQAGSLPFLPKNCIAVGKEVEGTLGYQQAMMDKRPGFALGTSQPNAAQPYILTMTSGSTGQPKPIIFAQETKIRRAQSAIDCYGLTPTDVVLAATPMYHSLAQRLVLLPLMLGASVVIMDSFSPTGWAQAVARNKVSFTIPVASQLGALMPLFSANPTAFASLRVIVSSSAQISLELKQELSAKLNCEFHEIYGASEVGVVSNLAPQDAETKMASVGKPLPGIDLRIVDPDKQQLPVGEIGEIACATPTAFLGYFDRPEATAAAWHDGYFLTGDLGYLDTDGFLHFCGRKKDLIITGGINVYPIDIEKVLMQTGLLADCAVLGIPDAYFGEAVLACVVPKHPTTFNLRDVRRVCLTQLADFQQPLGFEILGELPKNAMGKTIKPQLQERFAGLDLSARFRHLTAKV